MNDSAACTTEICPRVEELAEEANLSRSSTASGADTCCSLPSCVQHHEQKRHRLAPIQGGSDSKFQFFQFASHHLLLVEMVRQDNLLALQPLLHRDDASVEVVHLLEDFLAAGLASRAALLQGMQPRMRCLEELLDRLLELGNLFAIARHSSTRSSSSSSGSSLQL